MELLDELYSGVPSYGATEVQAALGTSYAGTLSVLLLGPTAVALVVEPVLYLLADRWPRRWFVVGGVAVMGIAAVVAALVSDAWVLFAALSLAFVGSGCAVNLSQATLVDLYPERRERVMARWAILGEVGDVLAPLLIGAMALVALDWRAAFMAVGGLCLCWAVLLAWQHFPGAVNSEDEESHSEVGLWRSWVTALSNRRLMGWLAASAACDLMDELLVVLAVLYLRDVGMSAEQRTWVLTAGVVGALVGAALAERALARVDPMRLLLVASGGCLVLYVGWLMVSETWVSALLFFTVGASVAPMYPIASAQAYAALPGRSGAVHAAGHLFTPVTLGFPWFLGMLADHLGVRVALCVVLFQPVSLVLAAAAHLSRSLPQPK